MLIAKIPQHRFHLIKGITGSSVKKREREKLSILFNLFAFQSRGKRQLAQSHQRTGK
jgi:hypothetical protein